MQSRTPNLPALTVSDPSPPEPSVAEVGNAGTSRGVRSLVGSVLWVLRDFGPLLVFYSVNHFVGFIPALIATMVWSAADVSIVKLKGGKVSTFLKFSIVVTLLFGAVDLYLQGPFLFRYEAALTNVVTGIFFGLTLRGGKSIIQEFAEQRALATGTPVPITPDTLYYFRLCTMAWTAYFFVKAAFYVWVGHTYDLEHALAIRTLVGNATLYPLIFVSSAMAPAIIRRLTKAGLTPSAKEAALAAGEGG